MASRSDRQNQLSTSCQLGDAQLAVGRGCYTQKCRSRSTYSRRIAAHSGTIVGMQALPPGPRPHVRAVGLLEVKAKLTHDPVVS